MGVTAPIASEGVRYFGGSPVELGDRVEVRGSIFFFSRKKGRVIYVPGISQPNPALEFNGPTWIGVDFDNGTFSGTLVDPHAGCLQKIVTFLERDPTAVREIQPGESLDE